MKDIYQNKEKIQFTGTFWGESNNLEKIADKGTKIIEKMIRNRSLYQQLQEWNYIKMH